MNGHSAISSVLSPLIYYFDFKIENILPCKVMVKTGKPRRGRGKGGSKAVLKIAKDEIRRLRQVCDF